ncbi:MAG: HAMP domain-containing sensor histidine kinase [Gemmatimonadaceae bacterium]
MLFKVRQPRLLLLTGLLALSFVFTAILAYQAQSAARSHRETADRTLQDYASFAATEFGVYAKQMLSGDVAELLFVPADQGLGAPSRYRNPWSPDTSEQRAPCTGTRVDSGYFFFRLEFRTSDMPLTRGCASEAVRAWVRDTVPKHAWHFLKADYATVFGGIVGRVGDEPRLIGFVVTRNDSGVAVGALGFVTKFKPFAEARFAYVMKNYPLLPPAIVGQTPNDSLLFVYVTDTTAHELYRSKNIFQSPYAYKTTLGGYGGFVVHTVLRPEAAQRLVIGGLPRSRLPLLVGLLALSAGLVLISVQQIRREYELGRLRADFISSISHELRTPLAQVRMFAETLLLGRVRTDEERQRSLRIIDQEARRLTHLVENVLQFSRSERQLTRLSLESTEIAGQVSEAIEAFAPIAQARRVTVQADLISGIVAPVDRSALRQTMLNLLDNAVKYGPASQTVAVGMAAEHGVVRITVDDQGPGIALAERERIWTPFYRLERDANSAVAGSGIGLAVVRELVTQHGGRVWAERAKSGGSRFVVEFPGATRPTSGSDALPASAPENVNT